MTFVDGDVGATDPAQIWPGVLTTLIEGNDLDRGTAKWAMSEVMSGRAGAVPLAGFLVALRAKGETVEELSGLAASMLEHAVPITVPGRCVDIVGTGGDRAQTVNISTMSALVVAGAGLTVVKHGNRAASSKSGSADVLEQLGVRLDLPIKDVVANAIEVGITFCFAQVFHPSMRYAAEARSGLGVATAFNFLGPLTNPAQPGATAVGVADLRLAPLIAGVFADRGTNALVFRGEEGLDELAQTAASQVWEVRDGTVTHHRLDAVAELDIPPASLEELRGRDAAFNALVARKVLDGASGPVRDTVTLNAAATLVADGSLTGTGTLIERMRSGIKLAEHAIDSGHAAGVLDRWVAASQ